MCAAPDNANAVKAGHYIHGTAPDCALKGFQIHFPDALLVRPDADAIASLLLVIQGKVLCKSQHALAADALHLRGRNLAGEPAVLAIVFIMSAQILAAVNIQTRCINTGNGGAVAVLVAVEHILRHALANQICKIS